MYPNRFEEEEVPVYEEGKRYTGSQLDAMASQLLREDAKAEMCRDCGERGDRTEVVQTEAQSGVFDDEGNELALDFPEFACTNGHKWYQGEGTVRGIGGDNPILFEEHFQSRKRREIYNQIGVPDPSIVAGLYNRSHPQGRKINSEEQRKRNGASYYR